MAYKSKKQKEAEARAAAAEAKAAEAKIPDDVFQSEAFQKEMLRYSRCTGNIPMLLKAILEERVAIRLLLEGRV